MSKISGQGNHTFSLDVLDSEVDEFTEAITLATSGLLGCVLSPGAVAMGFLCLPLSDNSIAVWDIVTCKKSSSLPLQKIFLQLIQLSVSQIC